MLMLAFLIRGDGGMLPAIFAAEPIKKEAIATLAEGTSYKKAGKLATAVESYSRFIKLVPASKETARALVERAQCYQGLRNYKLAFADYAKASGLDPALRTVCEIGEAECYADLKEVESAVSLLTKIIAQRSRLNAVELGGAYLVRGNCYRLLRRWSDAIDDYKHAMKVPACKEAALMGMGLAYHELKQMRAALTKMAEVTWMDPKNVEAFRLIGNWWSECGEFRHAVDDYSTVLRLGGPQADVYTWRGNCRLQLGDKEAALEDCSEALRLMPSNTAALRVRARVYFDLGDDENAIADLSKAISLSPREKRLYLRRAEVYDDMKEPALAAQDRQAAQSLSR